MIRQPEKKERYIHTYTDITAAAAHFHYEGAERERESNHGNEKNWPLNWYNNQQNVQKKRGRRREGRQQQQQQQLSQFEREENVCGGLYTTE